MDSIALPPLPGTFDARKLRVDAIMRTLADRRAAKVEARSGFANLAEFMAARRAAAVEAAILRAAAKG